MPLAETIDLVRRHGAGRIALCTHAAPLSDDILSLAAEAGAVDLVITGTASSSARDLSPAQAIAQGIDGVVIADEAEFRSAMRVLEPLAHHDAIIVPQEANWIVPEYFRDMTPLQAAWNTTADVNYVSRSGLAGHYLEFGTFWGSSFFPAYFRHRQWLKGKFYAFDSFAGLSPPLPAETAYTQGDFAEGSYCCNERSFRATAELVAMPADRLVVVPGFYEGSLTGEGRAAGIGLDPESVSICVVDCDLKEPTAVVLKFVMPLLETGALLYFDDWRLCRASPRVGERSAVLEWLQRHPEIELIEFHRDHWQHQWFIFQRL